MAYPQPLAHLFLISFAILGATVGSFLNVCIYRLPKEYLSIVYPCSHCTFCGKEIRWFDNIPILSWLCLGGACRSCRSPIRLRYPLVELLTAVCFLACTYFIVLEAPLFSALDSDQNGVVMEEEVDRIVPIPVPQGKQDKIRDGFRAMDTDGNGRITLIEWQDSDHTPAFSHLSLSDRWIALIAALYLVGNLIVITFIDIDYRIIPNSLNYSGLLIAPAFSTLFPIFLRPIAGIEDPHLSGLIASFLGMLAGGGALYTVGVIGKIVFQKDAMGFGDVKMMAMVGGFLGWDAVLLAFLAACIVGTVLGIFWLIVTKDHYIPFGPYLAVGTFAVLLFKKQAIYLLFKVWPDMISYWLQPSYMMVR